MLRVLMLHVGCGFSMRETVVRAKQAQLAELSAVALFKRLRKSKDWLYRLCCALFEERGLRIQPPPNQRLRLLDSTQVKEPGKTGSLWRIHYSFQWKAWLYGKLFVALLTEKLIHHACAVSPWGYLLELTSLSQPMA